MDQVLGSGGWVRCETTDRCGTTGVVVIKIIPQGRIKYVQHLEGGIVEEILIKEGEKVEGLIKSTTDFGVFIELEGGIDGLVHLSDISWDES